MVGRARKASLGKSTYPTTKSTNSKNAYSAQGRQGEVYHEVFGDPTYADAILDRLINNAYRINLKGKTMRDVIDPTTGAPLAEEPEIGGIAIAPADG